MDRRGPIVVVGIALALGAGAWALHAWSEAEDEAARARARERWRAQSEERLRRLREESARMMPDVLEGIALGMTLDEVRTRRGRALVPSPPQGDRELAMHVEHLENGGRVVYGFSRGAQRLVQVQVLSLLPTHDAIAPHLVAMNERYGRPTGIWDCPMTGDVPTRRFTWRGSTTTVSDVFLLYGERVSVTLYIATSEQIGRSLAMAGCTPVPAERVHTFPVASPERIRAAARQAQR